MRKPVFVVSMFALTLAVAPACATKKFVRTEVGQVNDKVTTLGSSLEQTQERVRQERQRQEGQVQHEDPADSAERSSPDLFARVRRGRLESHAQGAEPSAQRRKSARSG